MIQSLDDTYFMKKALQEAEIAFDKGEVPISFNTIQEGINNTNISIDNSSSIAMIGGGSSINMMEINGYMSV